VALVAKTKQASISSVQRHLRIGYNRAARIIETMEKEGLIGPADGAKPREILMNSYDNFGS
jgi:S-DNA-T family DNA segregation ATPase FtsK/SpoIIIE